MKTKKSLNKKTTFLYKFTLLLTIASVALSDNILAPLLVYGYCILTALFGIGLMYFFEMRGMEKKISFLEYLWYGVQKKE